MNKEEFLNTLKNSLVEFTEEERREILYDYEEHFRTGIENGKTEAELISELGNPVDIAAQYKRSGYSEAKASSETFGAYQTSENSDSFNAAKKEQEQKPIFISIIVALALLFFNLVFVFGPYVGLGGVLIGLFGAALGFTAGGAGLALGTIFPFTFRNYISLPWNLPPAAAVFFGIGTTAFGLLFFIGDFYAAKYFIIGTVKYIKWNIKIITR